MMLTDHINITDDFTMAVCSSATLLPTKMFRLTTNYEVVTMAIIVVLMKMMFSLDGKTEHYMSELAKEVGRLVYPHFIYKLVELSFDHQFACVFVFS